MISSFLVRAMFVGVTATVLLDLWSMLLARFGVPATNWAMVGRWFGNMPRGRFVHANIADARAVPGERAIGWAAHYAVGVAYAALLLVICGPDWARAPTLLPALAFGLATIAAPFLIMQPAMGAGFAASKTPSPAASRLKTLAAHVVFGVGLYGAAGVAARLLPV